MKIKMKKSTILELITHNLVNEYLIDSFKINGDSELSDFGLDSLDGISIVMSIEMILSIDIDDSQLGNIKTLNDLVDVIDNIVNTDKVILETVNFLNLDEGIYYLYCADEILPVLVHLYYNTDAKCKGLGFNNHDGCGFLPLSDLTKSSHLKKVIITVSGDS